MTFDDATLFGAGRAFMKNMSNTALLNLYLYYSGFCQR
jgi:hypothetical protein